MGGQELSDTGFDDYRKQLLRAKYVGDKDGQTTEVTAYKKHLYEETINDIPDEALASTEEPRDNGNIISEMRANIQDDLNALQQDTDAALRRIRIQSLAPHINGS